MTSSRITASMPKAVGDLTSEELLGEAYALDPVQFPKGLGQRRAVPQSDKLPETETRKRRVAAAFHQKFPQLSDPDWFDFDDALALAASDDPALLEDRRFQIFREAVQDNLSSDVEALQSKIRYSDAPSLPSNFAAAQRGRDRILSAYRDFVTVDEHGKEVDYARRHSKALRKASAAGANANAVRAEEARAELRDAVLSDLHGWESKAKNPARQIKLLKEVAEKFDESRGHDDRLFTDAHGKIYSDRWFEDVRREINKSIKK